MDTEHSLKILASTSGLGDERIAELWEGADLYARAHTGNGDSAAYRTTLYARMAELLEREVAKRTPEGDASWVLLDAHVGPIYVTLADALKAAANRGRHMLH
jgi:hypothetical protein